MGDAYDALGRMVLATSYSYGAVVNQVQRIYDGLGNLVKEYQSSSGSVDTSTTSSVQYQYDTSYEGDDNYNSLTGVTYPSLSGSTMPSGSSSPYQLTYGYSDTTGLDASIGRIASVADSSRTLESYQYLGLSAVTSQTLTQPGVTEAIGLNILGQVNTLSWDKGGYRAGKSQLRI